LCRNLSLRAERDAIRRELKSAAASELQMYRHLRKVGEHWIAAKVELGNRGLSIHRWAKDNVSIGRQWLDRHAELFKRWAEFLEARKWADSMPYAPNRQLGLETAFRLMDEKKRFDAPTMLHQNVLRQLSAIIRPLPLTVWTSLSAKLWKYSGAWKAKACTARSHRRRTSMQHGTTSTRSRLATKTRLTIILAGWSQSLAKCVEFCVMTAHYGFAWETPMPERRCLDRWRKATTAITAGAGRRPFGHGFADRWLASSERRGLEKKGYPARKRTRSVHAFV
jgi:hypothetical protein